MQVKTESEASSLYFAQMHPAWFYLMMFPAQLRYMGELWKCREERLTSELNLKRLKRNFNEATYRQLRINEHGL